jgi:hypothetical protein
VKIYSKLPLRPVEVVMRTEIGYYVTIANDACYYDVKQYLVDSNNKPLTQKQLDIHLRTIDFNDLIHRLKDPNFLYYGRIRFVRELKRQNLTETQKRLVKMYETKNGRIS